MIDIRIKKLFFDRRAVIDAVDKVSRQVLSKICAFVRTAERSSIRKRRGSSAPGRPPHSHTGLLRRFIFFGYDRDAGSVVIGPAKLNKGGETPHVLEFGGTTVIEKRRLSGERQRRRVTIQPRPYMGPALQREKSKLPSMWANSIKG